MDDPGVTVFQGLNVGDYENREQEEDLKDELMRKQELQDLLTNALDEFKFEDTTIHSSSNGSIIEEDYKEAQTQYEQLKYLYDIRTREIQKLREEFESYKNTKNDEINSLNRKLTLQEAETSQAEISLRNAKSLLVEKTEIIEKQAEEIASKSAEIISLKKVIENMQYDLQAYKTSIDELQLKLAMDSGPYNVAARVLKSEELRDNHRAQVEKLETLLEEQRKKIEILEKERSKLETEMQNNIENNKESKILFNNTINLLNSNVENAQQQCTDLLNLVEMLSKENEHYRDRIVKLEAQDPIVLNRSFRRKSLDYDTLMSQNERLKKIILDKDAEVSTLKSKTKFYENDVKELLEYRNLKTVTAFNRDCDYPEHLQKLIVLQNEVKDLSQKLLDKERVVSNLSAKNEELEQKIESLIIQTRNDLVNISQKYKVPELETMNEELHNAELRIKDLQEKLTQYEKQTERNIILDENVKKGLEEKKLFETKFNKLKVEYDQLTNQLKEMTENCGDDAVPELTKLKEDIEKFWTDFDGKVIETQLLEIIFTSWLNQINLTCMKIKQLIESRCILKQEIDYIKSILRDSQKEMTTLTEILEREKISKTTLQNENTDLNCKLNEKSKELEQLKAEKGNNSTEITEYQNQLSEHRAIIERLENDLKQSQNEIEKLKNTKNIIDTPDVQMEVLIREELAREYESKIRKLEETYKNIDRNNSQKYLEKENKYRQEFADLLNRYAQVVSAIQNENDALKLKVARFEQNYVELEKFIENLKEKCVALVDSSNKEAMKSVQAWKTWAKTFVHNCVGVEKLNEQTRCSVLSYLKDCDSQIESIIKLYDEKIRHLKKRNILET